MSKRRKLLFVNTVLLSVYLIVSTIFYLSEGDSLEGFAIAGAVYLLWVLVHEGVILLAVSAQWLGYLSRHRIGITISNILQFLGSVIFPIALIITIPLIFINLLTFEKKKKIEKSAE